VASRGRLPPSAPSGTGMPAATGPMVACRLTASQTNPGSGASTRGAAWLWSPWSLLDRIYPASCWLAKLPVRGRSAWITSLEHRVRRGDEVQATESTIRTPKINWPRSGPFNRAGSRKVPAPIPRKKRPIPICRSRKLNRAHLWTVNEGQHETSEGERKADREQGQAGAIHQSCTNRP
jgi:hypothetical protein